VSSSDTPLFGDEHDPIMFVATSPYFIGSVTSCPPRTLPSTRMNIIPLYS